MDQEDRSPSTRPNPFSDDADSLSRKRRRTSCSGSSVGAPSAADTESSSEHAAPTPTVNDVPAMDIDTPPPKTPSTPPRPTHLSTEPVSSKVTLNLRNAESHHVDPRSPSSPVPTHLPAHMVRASIEGLEPRTPDTPAVEVSTARSSPAPQDALMISDDEEDDDDEETEQRGSSGRIAAQDCEGFEDEEVGKELYNALVAFPYTAPDDTSYMEALARISHFIQQPSVRPDDIIQSLRRWVSGVLRYAEPQYGGLVLRAYRENPEFWTKLPELFTQVSQRANLSKSPEIHSQGRMLMFQACRLATFLVAVDCRLLAAPDTGNDPLAVLVSPPYAQLIHFVIPRDEGGSAHTNEHCIEMGELLGAFQSPSNQSPATGNNRLAAVQAQFLSSFPQKTGINLVKFFCLVDSVQSWKEYQPGNVDDYIAPEVKQLEATLERALEFFNIVSQPLENDLESLAANLQPDIATAMVAHFSNVYKYALQGTHSDAVQAVSNHRKNNPTVSPNFTVEALALEWRFRLFNKLARCSRVHLRVSAVSHMCSDLLSLWKRLHDRGGDEECAFRRLVAESLMSTGIFDYVLGSTCHPEVSQQSANAVGFLMVTKTYSSTQTDLLWQTITTCQDPRICQALVHMMSRILNICDLDNLSYLCTRFMDVRVDAFNPSLRDLFHHTATSLPPRLTNLPHGPEAASFQLCVGLCARLCVQLLQKSSVYGPQGTIAYPEVFYFARRELCDLLKQGILEDSNRGDLAKDCLQDIEAQSPTTPGSIQALGYLFPSIPQIQRLNMSCDLLRLLVNEFASSTQRARAVHFTPLYSHVDFNIRRKFISHALYACNSSVDKTLLQKLWNHLVGVDSLCSDDRNAGWEDILAAVKSYSENPRGNAFVTACFESFLPDLAPSYYCLGSLDVIREDLLPRAKDQDSTIWDKDSDELELLWRIILTTPDDNVGNRAIHTLVTEIYGQSELMRANSLNRARQAHSSLVSRCLRQLKEASRSIKKPNGNTSSGEDESIVTVPFDGEIQKQGLKFVRTLKVLSTLLQAPQSKFRFSAPDLRSLTPSNAGPAEGDLIQLKYQTFDDASQSDILSLSIGLGNTCASLLASLREASGFDNFRLFWRGAQFCPSDDEAQKTIQSLNLHSGLILVRKEDPGDSPTSKSLKRGMSSLEMEVLDHFKDFWEYLSMETKLAREVYEFLVGLPTDDSVLAIFEDSTTSYREVFPSGQPFKSLYALHAINQFLDAGRRRTRTSQLATPPSDEPQKVMAEYRGATNKVASWIIGSICETDMAGRCSNNLVQMTLCLRMVVILHTVLKESEDASAVNDLLSEKLQESLLSIITRASSVSSTQLGPTSTDLVSRAFEAVLESSARSRGFWDSSSRQSQIQNVVRPLLLDHPVKDMRIKMMRVICNKICYNNGLSGTPSVRYARLFWLPSLQLIPEAVKVPGQCEESFIVVRQLFGKLANEDSELLDLDSCIAEWGKLILSHQSTEDVALPQHKDGVAHGITILLWTAITHLKTHGQAVQLPLDFPTRVWQKHLYPDLADGDEYTDQYLVPRVIAHPTTRNALYEIILLLITGDKKKITQQLQSLAALVPYGQDRDDDPYAYELPQQFDRIRAIRSPCGYAGLRNLSNTCYMNSLLTQLFMNIEFRSFILQCRPTDVEEGQVLRETQYLFANLQDSRRRYMDPASLIEHIRDYEGSLIDIHIQMDVDEFSSLFFDRLEEDIHSDIDKRRLRSTYGGKLVQQTKSLQCEHISERVESFSAIQCDVKGKTHLAESLQAYVDGEVLEGENQYKCTSCNRHVDAVKRACLKDLPDHVMFHLKRFDFDLRTLQRHKINDYFSFPRRIDMRPYTVEYLSNPDQKELDSDVFELTGVIVHSGTAETGHYYSITRERPGEKDEEAWIEFNDDTVTSLDPSLLENACFGGQEHRQYDNVINSFEKAHSAYMLFYQRSSSLGVHHSGLQIPGRPGPVRAPIPDDLGLQIKLDNWAVVKRHCLYDPSHMPFVYKVLSQVWGSPCSEAHEEENLAMGVALSHLDQTVARAKDAPEFDTMRHLLGERCNRCAACSLACFEYFQRCPEALKATLLRNFDSLVRYEIGQMLITSLKKIKADLPDMYHLPDDADAYTVNLPMVQQAASVFSKLFNSFFNNLKAWPELFGTIVDFARLGLLERCALLGENLLLRTGYIIFADGSMELPPAYIKLVQNLQRRIPSRIPSYENVIELIWVLLEALPTEMSLETLVEDAKDRGGPLRGSDLTFFTSREISMFHEDWRPNTPSPFADKLIRLNQNPASTDRILLRLSQCDPALELRIHQTLRAAITYQPTRYPIAPYLRTASYLCCHIGDATNVSELIMHVNLQCQEGIMNSEAKAFYEFQISMWNPGRYNGETALSIEVQNLEALAMWVPGILLAADPPTTSGILSLLDEKLFRHGPLPEFSQDEGGAKRSSVMIEAARQLGIGCLLFLQMHYITPSMQAPSHIVNAIQRVIEQCVEYYTVPGEDSDDVQALDLQFQELYPLVLQTIQHFVVDEVEEEGDGMWSDDSSTSTLDYN